MKNILVIGGTGFLGKSVIKFMRHNFNDVKIVSLSRSKTGEERDVTYLRADASSDGYWLNYLEIADVIVNLSGYPIYAPWVGPFRKAIVKSRVDVTLRVANYIKDIGGKLLINASAVGAYSKGFLGELCSRWEEAAFCAAGKNRVVVMRIGVVIGNGGFVKMIKDFSKVGFIPVPGSGRQKLSWICIGDFVRAIGFFMENESADGIYNLVACEPVSYIELVNAISNKVKIHVPEYVFKFMGDYGRMFTESIVVYPERLVSSGFNFMADNVEKCLKEMLV